MVWSDTDTHTADSSCPQHSWAAGRPDSRVVCNSSNGRWSASMMHSGQLGIKSREDQEMFRNTTVYEWVIGKKQRKQTEWGQVEEMMNQTSVSNNQKLLDHQNIKFNKL